MAKVKPLPSRNTFNFGVNDALSNLISLEVSDESPPKHDIQIDFVLIGDNIRSYRQPVNRVNVNKIENGSVVSSEHHISGNVPSLISVGETSGLELLKEGNTHNRNKDHCKKFDNSVSMAPIISSCGNVVANCHMSLSSLAENHLNRDEKPQESKDSCSDLDFTLEDLLSDIGSSSVTIKSSKPLNSNGDFNLFSLSFPPNNDYKLEIEHQKEVIDDDLSILLDSSEIQQQSSSFSLADLANSHFLNNLPSNANEYLKENSSNGIEHGCENGDFKFALLDRSESILTPGKLDNVLTIEENVPLVSKIGNATDAVANYDEYHTISHKSSISDNEIVPDIDLSFCIKKPKSVQKDKFGFGSGSPESTDSGFDETDSMSIKCIPSFQDFVSFHSTCPYEKEFKSPLTNLRQSLLSKAISCKSKMDKAKCEKLKKIRKELCNNYSPTVLFNCKIPNVARYDNIIDQSNQCVINKEVSN